LSQRPPNPRVFRGLGASYGVAIGQVFLLQRGVVQVPRYHVADGNMAQELGRLQAAVDASVAQLQAVRQDLMDGGAGPLSILQAHEMMLRDQAWVNEVKERIETAHINAEWAISQVVRRLRRVFDVAEDAYLRERGGDIDFIGERILRNLAGPHADLTLDIDPEIASVVVARNLSPVDAALLSRHRIAGFVTDMGGKTSHIAIIARSLEMPAVVGARGAFDAAGSNDRIIVDGSEGTVILRPSPSQQERGERRAIAFAQKTQKLLAAKFTPARTRDGYTVTVAGNIEHPGETSTILARGGEAIGLYRTEFMFSRRQSLPTADDHYRSTCAIFEKLGDRSLTVRTLDLGGDKLLGPLIYDKEPNPALGLRAIRFCLQHRDIFRAQIAGLLRAAVHGKLQIMLPMISDIEELRTAKEIIAEVAQGLRRDGIAHRADVPLGIMIEVPSAALMAPELARECAFFSLGTNDLLQYILAVDRGNERVAHLYRPLHPAVLRVLGQVAEAARLAGIPLSVCGEMAGDVELTPILLALDIQQLSMQSSSIPHVKRRIQDLDRGACRGVLERALGCSSAGEVEAVLREFLDGRFGPTDDVGLGG
jgi:phosphotransferase system enzyme I (PtsI)